MAAAVHYVGGPKDGDTELVRGRPSESHLVAVGHGRRSLVYWLCLIELDGGRSVFVYAASGMALASVRRIVEERLLAGGIDPASSSSLAA